MDAFGTRMVILYSFQNSLQEKRAFMKSNNIQNLTELSKGSKVLFALIHSNGKKKKKKNLDDVTLTPFLFQ